jgi:predicted nucleic acid-binding protein
MTVVVDASVVTKWVLDENGSDRANALRDEDSLIAPSLVASEVGNALWKAVGRGDIDRTEALVVLRAVLRPFSRLVPNEQLSVRALEFAINLDHPIYDCFYLALAEREGVPLVSADAALVTKAKKAKVKARML